MQRMRRSHAEQLPRLCGTNVMITCHGHMRMRCAARWRVEHGDRMFRRRERAVSRPRTAFHCCRHNRRHNQRMAAFNLSTRRCE